MNYIFKNILCIVCGDVKNKILSRLFVHDHKNNYHKNKLIGSSYIEVSCELEKSLVF